MVLAIGMKYEFNTDGVLPWFQMLDQDPVGIFKETADIFHLKLVNIFPEVVGGLAVIDNSTHGISATYYCSGWMIALQMPPMTSTTSWWTLAMFRSDGHNWLAVLSAQFDNEVLLGVRNDREEGIFHGWLCKARDIYLHTL